ncbi:DUF4062 domain-containing protein [Pseudomonas stutzeri]|uniref:DUF4062 domain-containing protein n=1 Tax=Stutzerimonas stutzeri TaxID=316 RepID=UPI001F526FE0|nr:DUF4062 domain-containing protein [Stutzerimonas stutzeri]MCI0918115.1 DUF4062 domain-containing protein [Stutzerimonas stutzeri]
MANPRVFISSTCYDLASERDSLIDFCHGFGFDVALSERGDVFFHPDLHTHEACVNEVGGCHLFVLIVGGRFGGRYNADPAKSITNAEYVAARQADIPIFTFIKQDVLQDHNVWQSNKDKKFVSEIHYPSIDNQKHASEIFKFIDDVRLAKSGNSYFPFTLPREIHQHLRKQWASMFLEWLKQRNIAKQMLITNEALARLASASQKIEEITKSIYKNVDKDNAAISIGVIDDVAEAKKMFYLIGTRIEDGRFISDFAPQSITESPPASWWEFLIASGYFTLSEDEPETKSLIYLVPGGPKIPITPNKSKKDSSQISLLEESYEKYRSLTPELRREIVSEFSFIGPGK